jgi:hypothetical protein
MNCQLASYKDTASETAEKADFRLSRRGVPSGTPYQAVYFCRPEEGFQLDEGSALYFFSRAAQAFLIGH